MPATAKHYASRARSLALFTVAYNVVEGAVSIGFGSHDSVLSLVGFGLDSFLEAATALVVLWRLGGLDHEREEMAEKIIGGLLMLLALGLALGASVEFFGRRLPEHGAASIVIALVSLSVMAWLYRAKMEVAHGLNSRALLLDAFCTKSCMWLSGLLLGGALVLEVFGWRLFDPIVSLAMAWLIWREGAEAWQDEHVHS